MKEWSDQSFHIMVDRILKEIYQDLKLSQELDRFAAVLKQEGIPIYTQLTCPLYVEGLDFCCPSWRHQRSNNHTGIVSRPKSKTTSKGKISAQPHTSLCMQNKLIMHALYCF